jgi:hypothetical protein
LGRENKEADRVARDSHFGCSIADVNHPFPVLAAMLLAAGCSGQPLCVHCPAIGGTFSISWESAPEDLSCAILGPRPRAITFTQYRAGVQATVGPVTLGGSIFDSWDFALSGGSTEVSYSMNGHVVPLVSSADAGVSLVGVFSTRSSEEPSNSPRTACQLRENFTANLTAQ